MKLDFIDLGKLSVSKANMRFSKKAPDVSDILPTVRQRGVIVPCRQSPILEGQRHSITSRKTDGYPPEKCIGGQLTYDLRSR
ncbi:hypothetical protein [Novosphingobium rosa]|uniref:hypothetical protein n=1 Tax=Novosphingobium rosa TaxID=76978 RepID=UPI000A9B1351|nr:hypothetical protein [Novosphingobium rosa]